MQSKDNAIKHKYLLDLSARLNKIQKRIYDLQRYEAILNSQIKRIQSELASNFERRLFVVSAELLSITPTNVASPKSSSRLELEIKPNRTQFASFVRKFMDAGMSKKDAENVICRITSRFRDAALFTPNYYFEVTLPEQLAKEITQGMKICYGLDQDWHRKYWVKLTRKDIVAGEKGIPTLSETAKQKLRLSVLTATALCETGIFACQELNRVRKALEECLDIYVSKYTIIARVI